MALMLWLDGMMMMMMMTHRGPLAVALALQGGRQRQLAALPSWQKLTCAPTLGCHATVYNVAWPPSAWQAYNAQVWPTPSWLLLLSLALRWGAIGLSWITSALAQLLQSVGLPECWPMLRERQM
jgi:hypothetical protein